MGFRKVTINKLKNLLAIIDKNNIVKINKICYIKFIKFYEVYYLLL